MRGMEESDDEIYRRHFEMEADRIREERIKAKAKRREERIKAKAVADARKASRTKKEIKRDEERKERKAREAEELARQQKESSERIKRMCRQADYAFLISLGLVIACFGLFFYLPQTWGIFLMLLSLVVFFLADFFFDFL